MEKQEKRERKLLTENRLATINKRETSFEGLIGQLENGEDGIYNLLTNDKNVIFQPKISITRQDLEEIEPLRELRKHIEKWEGLQKKVSGKDAFIVKRSLIEMRKDQYLIKNVYKPPIIFNKLTRNVHHCIELPFEEWVDEDGNVKYTGISFLDHKVVSAILCNFRKLKEHSRESLQSDTWYMVRDFEILMNKVLDKYPLYKRIVEYKMEYLPNTEIQELLTKEFGFSHSLEYLSSLWRNKIPKLIASQAMDDWVVWYYSNIEHGEWKTCNRCGQTKLAHSRFYSINKTSKDGWYSICKECRNKKKRKKERDWFDEC
jgi:hypothetical protein